MASTHSHDVLVIGGGIAGSSLAGVRSRSGLGVLVVEKEPKFRDRASLPTSIDRVGGMS